MKFSTTRQLFQYWHSLKAEAKTHPSRRSFNPMAVPHLLPNVLLIDTCAPNTGTIRLAGTGLDALYQRHLKGEHLPTLFVSADQSTVYTALQGLEAQYGAIVIQATMDGPKGVIVSEFVFMSLTNDDGIPYQALAMQTTDAGKLWKFTRSPGLCKITSFRIINPDEALRVAGEVATDAPTATVIDFSRRGRAPANARKVAHLSVIEGGDQL